MKHYELDLIPKPIENMELELFRIKNIVQMLEKGEHLPFIKRQNEKAIQHLYNQDLEKYRSLFEKISLMVKECSSLGIDIQDFEIHDLTQQGI